jgi:CRISPR-associated endonuclease Cas3-HD
MTAIAKRTLEGTLPLPQHGLDVACCLEALLEEPVFEARVAAALGAPLDPVTRERLLLLAFLHDLGKASSHFQARTRAATPWRGVLTKCPADPARGKALS